MVRSLAHLLVVMRLRRHDEAGVLPESVDSGGVEGGGGADVGGDAGCAIDEASDGDGVSAGRWPSLGGRLQPHSDRFVTVRFNT